MLVVEPENISYEHFEGAIPSSLPIGTFVSLSRNQPLKIHSLGFQPAKSIPELPRWFLRKYASASFTVFEPFAGSGTTLIESLSFGASVLWLDYNPLSRLICRVKTMEVPALEAYEEAQRILFRVSEQASAPTTVQFANKNFWFQKQVQEGLEILKEHISQAREHIQPVLWLAFSSTVRKTSDMNDGMILAARRSHVTEVPKRTRYDVYRYFKHYVEKALEALDEWRTTSRQCLGNAEELPLYDARSLYGDWTCDAVVTSPPYINAIDYVWAAKFELHWLGFVTSDPERLSLYATEIGTERIPKQECQELGRTGNALLDPLLEDIYLGKRYVATKGQNALRSRVTYKYFIDMKEHFAQSYAHLRPGGYYCFSIGDVSRICGVEIPAARILAELAEEVGFREVFHFHLLLKNRKLNIPRNVDWAGTIKHDTTIVLEKPQ